MPSRYRGRDGRTRAAYRLPRWARDEIEHLHQQVQDQAGAAETCEVLQVENASLRRRLARAEADAYDSNGVRLDASDEET